jgi:hypothetical protein
MVNPVRQAANSIDRRVIGPWRWRRLRRELDMMSATPGQERSAVQAEIRRQLGWYGPTLDLPAWARKIVAFRGSAAGGSVPTPARVSDVAALRSLVLYLHARRGQPISLAARDFGAHQPGLGERWADDAIKRLAAVGVLYKARGAGGRLPGWNLVALDEAMSRLGSVAS